MKHIYKKEHGHIEVNEAGREIIPYLITLEIGKNVKRYDVLRKHDGTLKVTRGDVTIEYVSEFCGASHSRTQKNVALKTSWMIFYCAESRRTQIIPSPLNGMLIML